jgi:hypothetical protein
MLMVPSSSVPYNQVEKSQVFYNGKPDNFYPVDKSTQVHCLRGANV